CAEWGEPPDVRSTSLEAPVNRGISDPKSGLLRTDFALAFGVRERAPAFATADCSKAPSPLRYAGALQTLRAFRPGSDPSPVHAKWEGLSMNEPRSEATRK